MRIKAGVGISAMFVSFETLQIQMFEQGAEQPQCSPNVTHRM